VNAAQELLRANEGVLCQRLHPRGTLNGLLTRQAIVRVLPGVFVDTELLACRRTRYLAALTARPAAVLWGDSAVAAITADRTPFVAGELIELAEPEGRRIAGLTVRRRSAHSIRLFNGLRCPTPAIVAVEAAVRDQGRTAELLLRTGLVAPAQLVDALSLFDGSCGQQVRRDVIVSYADNPWSGGERDLQQVLRGAGVHGWVANVAIRLAGATYYPDLLFEAARLIVEFDGFAVHGTRQAFEADRVRQNRLMAAGFRVLRYTWQRLQDDPEGIVAEIKSLLAQSEPTIC
jgi:very-short-patch-repair endonuclease